VHAVKSISLPRTEGNRQTEWVAKVYVPFEAGSANSQYDANREIELLAKIPKHDNVIRVHGFLKSNLSAAKAACIFKEIPKAPQTYGVMVMERCQCSLLELLNYTGALTEVHTAYIASCLLQALLHIHSHGIAHRDVTAGNVLLSDNGRRVVLSDFGLSLQTKSMQLFEWRCGTPGYVAPEVWLSKTGSAKSEVFSVGVIIYLSLTLLLPFQRESDVETAKATVRGDINLKKDGPLAGFSSRCRCMLKDTFRKEVTRRPTPEEALAHPWLKMHSSKIAAEPEESQAAAFEEVARSQRAIQLGFKDVQYHLRLASSNQNKTSGNASTCKASASPKTEDEKETNKSPNTVEQKGVPNRAVQQQGSPLSTLPQKDAPAEETKHQSADLKQETEQTPRRPVSAPNQKTGTGQSTLNQDTQMPHLNSQQQSSHSSQSREIHGGSLGQRTESMFMSKTDPKVSIASSRRSHDGYFGRLDADIDIDVLAEHPPNAPGPDSPAGPTESLWRRLVSPFPWRKKEDNATLSRFDSVAPEASDERPRKPPVMGRVFSNPNQIRPRAASMTTQLSLRAGAIGRRAPAPSARQMSNSSDSLDEESDPSEQSDWLEKGIEHRFDFERIRAAHMQAKSSYKDFQRSGTRSRIMAEFRQDLLCYTAILGRRMTTPGMVFADD
jgi:serine/threonine protein kinase